MKIVFDPVKRDATLDHRGLDFADAREVFAGPLIERVDDRLDYGEVRRITIGLFARAHGRARLDPAWR